MSTTIPSEAVEQMKRRTVELRITSMRDGIIQKTLLTELIKLVKEQDIKDVRKAFIESLDMDLFDLNPAELGLDYGHLVQTIDNAVSCADVLDIEVVWEKTDETPDREWQQSFIDNLNENLGVGRVSESFVALTPDEASKMRDDIAERAASYASTPVPPWYRLERKLKEGTTVEDIVSLSSDFIKDPAMLAILEAQETTIGALQVCIENRVPMAILKVLTDSKGTFYDEGELNVDASGR